MTERTEAQEGVGPVDSGPEAEPAAVEGHALAGTVGAQLVGRLGGGRFAGGRADEDPHLARLRNADPQLRAAAMLRLQQGAGNAVVARLIGTKAFEVAKLIQLPEPERLEALKKRVEAKDTLAVERIWSSFGAREVEIARDNRDLFVKSMEFAGSGILEHQPWQELKKKFKSDVLATATANLESNRDFVQNEMKKTGAFGVEGEGKDGKTPAAEDPYGVRDVQLILEEIDKFKKAEIGFRSLPVGWNAEEQGGDSAGGMGGRYSYAVATFDPTAKPMYPPDFKPPEGQMEHGPSKPGEGLKFHSWEEVNKEYQPVAAAIGELEQRSPAAMIISQEGKAGAKPGDVAKMDLESARKEIGKGLQTLMQRIEKAVPLVGTKLEYTDFVPIHEQLLRGAAPGASGIRWSDPLEKSIVQRDLKNAEVTKLLTTLGLGALAAAAFIFAPFASVPMAAFLTTVGVGIGVGQAVASWDKYSSLSAGQEASIDPKLALIKKEQVGSALFAAILDTAFAFLDAAGAVVAAIKGLRAGAALVKAAEAGAKEAAFEGLKNVTKESGQLVEKAVAELGAHEVAKRSNKSFSELAEIVGKESETGQKLTKLAGLGDAGAKKAAADVGEQLAKLGTLAKEEANKVVLEAIEHFGAAGVVKQTGGWKSVIGKVGDGPGGQALEKWRQGVFGDLQKFLAKESEEATKGVRTGTKAPGSDLDIQAVGGEAARNAEKAKQWLGGRLGVAANDQELKRMLDATVFIDPTRSHLADLVKDLPEAARKAIDEKTASVQKSLIFAERFQAAKKEGGEALKRVTEEAEAAGIKAAELEKLGGKYKPLSPAEQGDLAKEIDGWMKQLKDTGGKDPALIEKISTAQAQINAANKEAYLGGGVRFWVTGRPGDVEEFAKAGFKIAADATPAQRVIAALSEGKFMDEAISTIRKGGHTAEEIGAALKDIGKHGAREAEVLTVPGKTATYELIEIGARLELLAKAAKPGGNLRRSIQAAEEMERILKHAEGLLGQLKGQSSTALKTLEGEAKIAAVSADELAKLQAWTRFDMKLSAAIDATIRSMGAVIEATHTAIKTAQQSGGDGVKPGGQDGQAGEEPNQSIAPPEPNQSVAP